MSYLLTAFVYIVFPYTAPNYLFLIIVRCIIGVTMAGPISNPLINDYVHRKYWGKAVALNGIGIIVGEVGAMLLNFATTNVSYYAAF